MHGLFAHDKHEKGKVKECIVLSEIHLRTTGRHLSMGSHSIICHPTEVTAPPSVIDSPWSSVFNGNCWGNNTEQERY